LIKIIEIGFHSLVSPHDYLSRSLALISGWIVNRRVADEKQQKPLLPLENI
jgi:hypothetical protein